MESVSVLSRMKEDVRRKYLGLWQASYCSLPWPEIALREKHSVTVCVSGDVLRILSPEILERRGMHM